MKLKRWSIESPSSPQTGFGSEAGEEICNNMSGLDQSCAMDPSSIQHLPVTGVDRSVGFRDFMRVLIRRSAPIGPKPREYPPFSSCVQLHVELSRPCSENVLQGWRCGLAVQRSAVQRPAFKTGADLKRHSRSLRSLARTGSSPCRRMAGRS